MSDINNISEYSEQNNYLRPYTSGVTPQKDNLATIILLQESSDQTAKELIQNTDYFSNFINKVEQPSFTTGKILVENIGSMTIPDITEGMKGQGQSEYSYYGVFNNFSLINVTEAKEQMTKIHMNFGGSWNAFFFGEKPTVYGFSGFFLDSQEYPYYQEFMVAYDQYLCGRKCVENNFQMFISYEGKIISGYILNINAGLDANNPYVKSFNFSVLVKDETWFRTNVITNPLTGKSSKPGLNYMSSIRTGVG